MAEDMQVGGAGGQGSVAVLPYTATELDTLAVGLETPVPARWQDRYPRTYRFGSVEVEVDDPADLACRLEESGPIYAREVAAVRTALGRPQILDVEPELFASEDGEQRGLLGALVVRILFLLFTSAAMTTLAAGSGWWWLLCTCTAVQLVAVGRAVRRLAASRHVSQPADPCRLEVRWLVGSGERWLGWRLASVWWSESRLCVEVQDGGPELSGW